MSRTVEKELSEAVGLLKSAIGILVDAGGLAGGDKEREIIAVKVKLFGIIEEIRDIRDGRTEKPDIIEALKRLAEAAFGKPTEQETDQGDF